MFEQITPEQAGISSAHVKKFMEKMEQHGFCSHGLVLMRDDKIFAEHYWAPYDKDSLNRMYSQTKSLVSMAIGLLQDEGKLKITDRIAPYFSDKIHKELDPYLAELTIRDMLTMRTTGQSPIYWLDDPSAVDRTEAYFRTVKPTRPGGTLWEYDSAGSQVLASLVERLSGVPLLEYLKEKIFDRYGSFSTAQILKCRNEDSWGDSALLCTVRDMCSAAHFLMNRGMVGDEQLLSRDYIAEATAVQADNNTVGFESSPFFHGYGYQIWCVKGGFGFVGMGEQLTVCYPEKNLIFSYTSDNQGYEGARSILMTLLDSYILENLADEPLADDPGNYGAYLESTKALKLYALRGATDSPFRRELDGVRYVCRENPSGIREFCFRFADEKSGVFHYRNEQEEKALPFGLGENIFCDFPQLGYSGLHGGVETTDGSMYRCASSLIFTEEKKLGLKVQIIDRYLGNLYFSFAFRGDEAAVQISHNAEAFLREYIGSILAKKAE